MPCIFSAIIRGAIAGFRFALAAAALALVVGTGTAKAQSPSELTRMIAKAEAHEQENGFCATLGWPRRTDLKAFFAFLNDWRQNSTYVSRAFYGEKATGCSYYRLISSARRDGKKCVNTMAWACFDGGECNAVGRMWCRESDGGWQWMKN